MAHLLIRVLFSLQQQWFLHDTSNTYNLVSFDTVIATVFLMI